MALPGTEADSERCSEVEGVPNEPAALARDEPALEPGTQIGEYRVIGRVGAGGFGSVYEGEQPVISKRVAIKVLSHRCSRDPEAVARFVGEARIANQLGHRNIVGSFSFGQLPDGRHYHVMDFVDGEPLDALIARPGGVPTPDALEILRGVAAALDAAHERGIVHRDLKPANVLVSRENGAPIAHVIDFGIAKLLSDDERPQTTGSGTILGTPGYMAPEQCRGHTVDARTDSYAFGLLAYELLTGSPVFPGSDRVDLFLKHTGEAPEPPSRRNRELSPAVDAVLLPLLEKDPLDRPELLGRVVTALERALEAPPAARRSSWPWLVMAGLVAAAVALVMRGPSTAPARVPRDSKPPATAAAAPERAPPLPTSAPTRAVRHVELRVRGSPVGAEVVAPDGRVVGSLPGVVELEANETPVELTFRKRGFRSAKRAVSANANGTIEVILERQSTRAVTGPGPDDFEDPFQ